MKINRISTSMIATLSFFIEKCPLPLYRSIGAIIPSFVTWWSKLATAPDTPTCIVIHGGQFTGGVHPRNQFVPEIVSPLPCLHALVCHTLLTVYFIKRTYFFHWLP